MSGWPVGAAGPVTATRPARTAANPISRLLSVDTTRARPPGHPGQLVAAGLAPAAGHDHAVRHRRRPRPRRSWPACPRQSRSRATVPGAAARRGVSRGSLLDETTVLGGGAVRRVVAGRDRPAGEAGASRARSDDELPGRHRCFPLRVVDAIERTDELGDLGTPGGENTGLPGSGSELESRRDVPIPVEPFGARPGHGAQSDRVLGAPHELRRATARPTDQHAAYYGARAAGGAGLIITEEHSTHPTDWPYEKLIHGFHRDVIPGYRRITEAVHRHRVPIFAQINHNGGQASSMYTRLPRLGAVARRRPAVPGGPQGRHASPRSTRSSPATRPSPSTAPRAASTASSCSAATRPSSAASCPPRRTAAPTTTADRWRTGPASLGRDRRRRAPGDRRPAGARRPALRRRAHRGRHDHRRGRRGGRIVEASGHVDYVNTSIGVATATLFMIEASMHVPPGLRPFIPSALRKAIDLPVVGVGRFKDPLAGRAGARRGSLRPRRASCAARSPTPSSRPRRAPGRPRRSGSCLSCNQECVGRMGLNRWLGCIENPPQGWRRSRRRRSGGRARSERTEAGRRGRRRAGRAAGR